MRIRARHYVTGELVDVVCEHGTICSISPPADLAADCQAGWVAPAWFDLQINGCAGHGFNSEQLTVEDVRHIVQVCRRHGIGALCPTLVTSSHAAMTHGLATLRRSCETDAELRVRCRHFIWRAPISRRKTDRAGLIHVSTFGSRTGVNSSSFRTWRAGACGS